LLVGAQDVFWEEEGAYTGEISVRMLSSAGCSYVIVGHSERRKYFGETDEIVNSKLKSVLEGGLKPVMCIGEMLDERRSGKTFKVIENQLKTGISGLSVDKLPMLTVAYEPVWAIGTGVNASPEQIGEAHGFIRELLVDEFNIKDVRILYGGSVNADNAEQILMVNHVNGALIGGASLKIDVFSEIIEIASKV
ncbi:MAG: triose-phosphate isomerase, partial [Fidelibacterota bacterium]